MKIFIDKDGFLNDNKIVIIFLLLIISGGLIKCLKKNLNLTVMTE